MSYVSLLMINNVLMKVLLMYDTISVHVFGGILRQERRAFGQWDLDIDFYLS